MGIILLKISDTEVISVESVLNLCMKIPMKFVWTIWRRKLLIRRHMISYVR